MKLAIVGTRTFYDYDLLTRTMVDIPGVTTIISGGASGADALAARYARENNVELVEHLPDWKSFGRKAGPRRNALIAADCDAMLAFWDGISRGTSNAIRCAQMQSKPVTVITVFT